MDPVLSRRTATLSLLFGAAILAGFSPVRAADQDAPLRGSGGRLFWQRRRLDEQERRRRAEEDRQQAWQDDRRRQRLREQAHRERDAGQQHEIDRALDRNRKGSID
jgi:hypothetical protein